MKVIVTGGSGFLGSHLCRFLVDQGCDVTILDSKNCDLRVATSLQVFNQDRFDIIFHLAAWTQAGDFCLTHPGEQWIINQQINTNTLAWWVEHQPQAKLVFMGTSCAYAEGSDLRESEYMIGEPIPSLHTYAMTKRMLYEGARSLHDQYQLRYLCAVPSTLYGPGYHTDGRQMHFVFDLMRKIIRGKAFGEEVVLWGDGYQRREVLLVADFVRALWPLATEDENDIYNIGAGEELTIREFASTICGLVGYPEEKLVFDEERYVGARSKCLDVEKLRARLPDFTSTPLEEGLRQTIEWFYESGTYRAPASR